MSSDIEQPNSTKREQAQSNLATVLEILQTSHQVSMNKQEIMDMFKNIRGFDLTLCKLNYIIKKNTSKIKSVRKGEYVSADKIYKNVTKIERAQSNLATVLEILQTSNQVSMNKQEILDMFKSIRGFDLTLCKLNYIIKRNTSSIISVKKGEYVCADILHDLNGN